MLLLSRCTSPAGVLAPGTCLMQSIGPGTVVLSEQGDNVTWTAGLRAEDALLLQPQPATFKGGAAGGAGCMDGALLCWWCKCAQGCLRIKAASP